MLKASEYPESRKCDGKSSASIAGAVPMIMPRKTANPNWATTKRMRSEPPESSKNVIDVKKISANDRISIERRRMAKSVNQPATGTAMMAATWATVFTASASA